MNRLQSVALIGSGIFVASLSAGMLTHRAILRLCDIELSRLVDAHSGCEVRLRWGNRTAGSWGEPVVAGTVRGASRQAPWGGLFEVRQLELSWGLKALLRGNGFETLSIASVQIPPGQMGIGGGAELIERGAGLKWPSAELFTLELSSEDSGERPGTQGMQTVLRWSGKLRVDGPVAMAPDAAFDRAEQTPTDVTFSGDVGFEGQVTLSAGSAHRLSWLSPHELTPNQPVASVFFDVSQVGVALAGREVKTAGEPLELSFFAGAAGPLWVFGQSPFFQGALRLERGPSSTEEAAEHPKNMNALSTRADLVLNVGPGPITEPSPAAVDALLERDRAVSDPGGVRILCPNLLRACTASWVNLPLRWLVSLAPDPGQKPLLRAVQELKVTGDGRWQVDAGKQRLDLRVTGASGTLHTAVLRGKIETSLARFVDLDTLREAAGVLMSLPGPAGSSTLREWRNGASPSAGPLEMLLPDDLVVDALSGAAQFEWPADRRLGTSAHASWLSLQSGFRTWESWHVTGLQHPNLLAAHPFPPAWPTAPATGGVRLGVQGAGYAELRLNVSADLKSVDLALDEAEKRRLLSAALAAGLGGKGGPVQLTLPSADELQQIEKDGKKWLDSFIQSQDDSATVEEKEAARRRMKESGDTLKGALRKLLGTP